MRNRILAAIGIVWLAATTTILVAHLATRTTDTRQTAYCATIPDDYYDKCSPFPKGYESFTVFDWGSWWAWAGGVTLVAIVASAVILTVWRPQP